MATLLELKCPRCGGAVKFDSSSQKVKCDYCGTEYDTASMMSYDESLNQEGSQGIDENILEGKEWEEGETEGLYIYSCTSCGGEVVGDATLSSTKCPYCDNPIVIKEQFVGDLKPDYIIPFKLNKSEAKAKFEQHLTGKRLLPKAFIADNHIDEIKGVYVPVWLYDSNVSARVTFRGERSRSWRSGDYEYTKTDYYALVRGGSISFCNVPVDGSEKMPDDLMESIEPFDFSEAVPFSTGYLAGYLADRYDADAQTQITRAQERISSSVKAAFYNTTMGYSHVITESSNVNMSDTTAKYALYPVWVLNTTWNKQNYTFAMNGQTGKFVGNLPVDKGLSWKYTLIIGGIVAVVVSIINGIALIL